MIKIQWTEAEESPTWETAIYANSYKDALQQLIKHVNSRDAIAEFFRVIETGIPAEDRYGREPDKVKSLAQYLAEFIEHEQDNGLILTNNMMYIKSEYNSWRELLEQALDAYESTEQVKIRIEKVL